MSGERAGPTSWRCSACGELHDELPFSYHSPAPASWEPELEHDPPRFGWLNTFLPYEPPTGGLPADVRTRPVGQRPLIELHPGDHPLIAEQREGITLARVQELAELLLHP